MGDELGSQSSTREEDDYQLGTNNPLPSSLKFLMNSMKVIAQNPLTTENHHIWSAQLLKIFKANGFIAFLDNSKTPPRQFAQTQSGTDIPNPTYNSWSQIDQNLSAAIYTTISPTLLPYVLNLEITAQIWDALNRRLQSTSRSRIIQLKNELHHLEMKDQTMSQYLTSIKRIVDMLAATGTHVDSEDIILYTLNGLSPAYQTLKVAVRTRPGSMPLEDFYSLLYSEEIHLQAETSKQTQNLQLAMSAFRTKENKQPYRGKGVTIASIATCF